MSAGAPVQLCGCHKQGAEEKGKRKKKNPFSFALQRIEV